MALAVSSLGETRQEWASAMVSEYGMAARDGRPMAFAIGCLIAAWREMPRYREGRLTLASHALALGVLIPTAAIQLACALGLPFLPARLGALYSLLSVGSAHDPFLLSSQVGAVPALLLLRCALAIGQVRLAWLLLERDWSRAFETGALIAAVTMTLLIFMQVLFIGGLFMIAQAAVLALELTAVLVAARWHERLAPNYSSEMIA